MSPGPARREVAMIGWWRELTAPERTAMIAAGGGWSVDAFDYMIYTFAIPP